VKVVASLEEGWRTSPSYAPGTPQLESVPPHRHRRVLLRTVDSGRGGFTIAPSRFLADGFRYGFGAELGISTQTKCRRGALWSEGLISYPLTPAAVATAPDRRRLQRREWAMLQAGSVSPSLCALNAGSPWGRMAIHMRGLRLWAAMCGAYWKKKRQLVSVSSWLSASGTTCNSRRSDRSQPQAWITPWGSQALQAEAREAAAASRWTLTRAGVDRLEQLYAGALRVEICKCQAPVRASRGASA